MQHLLVSVVAGRWLWNSGPHAEEDKALHISCLCEGKCFFGVPMRRIL